MSNLPVVLSLRVHTDGYRDQLDGQTAVLGVVMPPVPTVARLARLYLSTREHSSGPVAVIVPSDTHTQPMTEAESAEIKAALPDAIVQYSFPSDFFVGFVSWLGQDSSLAEEAASEDPDPYQFVILSWQPQKRSREPYWHKYHHRLRSQLDEPIAYLAPPAKTQRELIEQHDAMLAAGRRVIMAITPPGTPTRIQQELAPNLPGVPIGHPPALEFFVSHVQYCVERAEAADDNTFVHEEVPLFWWEEWLVRRKLRRRPKGWGPLPWGFRHAGKPTYQVLGESKARPDGGVPTATELRSTSLPHLCAADRAVEAYLVPRHYESGRRPLGKR